MEATRRRRECRFFDSVRVDVKDAGLVLVEPDGEMLGHDETFGKRGARGHALKGIGEPGALGRNAKISSRALPRDVATALCTDESALADSFSRRSFRMLLRTMCSARSSSFTFESERARRGQSWWSRRGSSVSWASNVVCTKRAASALWKTLEQYRGKAGHRRCQVASQTRDRHTAGRKRVTGDVAKVLLPAEPPAAASGTHCASDRANED
jgi:hypothetical protein